MKKLSRALPSRRAESQRVRATPFVMTEGAGSGVVKGSASEAERLLRARSLSGQAVDDLVSAILQCVGQGVRKKKGTSVLRKLKPGDVKVLADKGAMGVLVQAAKADDVLVRYAALLGLAQLALCPLRRKHFTKGGEGARVLHQFAREKDLDKCYPARRSLPHSLSERFKTFVGKEYEGVHPQVLCCLAFANLTEYQDCAPKYDTAALFLRDADFLESFSHLVGATEMCPASQHALGRVTASVVDHVGRTSSGEIDLFIQGGLVESLRKLIRAARENGADSTGIAQGLLHLDAKIQRHPDHPDNRL